jgi:GTPase involved in cell partitioning and DNA repair
MYGGGLAQAALSACGCGEAGKAKAQAHARGSGNRRGGGGGGGGGAGEMSVLMALRQLSSLAKVEEAVRIAAQVCSAS